MTEKSIYYVGIAVALAAIAVSLWQGHEVFYQQYGYKEAVATVVKVEIDKFMVGGDETPPSPRYRPKITREFSVFGEKFAGSAFSDSGKSIGNRKEAVALANSFKPGDSVTVFYDPRNPERSFLLRDFDWQEFIGCAFFFVVGLAMTISISSELRKAVPIDGLPVARV